MPLWLRTVFDDVCSFHIAGKQTEASLPESPCDSIKIRSVSSRPCEVPDLELHAVRWPGGCVSMRAHVQRLSSCVCIYRQTVLCRCAPTHAHVLSWRVFNGFRGWLLRGKTSVLFMVHLSGIRLQTLFIYWIRMYLLCLPDGGSGIWGRGNFSAIYPMRQLICSVLHLCISQLLFVKRLNKASRIAFRCVSQREKQLRKHSYIC